MRWPTLQQAPGRYWLKVYLLYVAFEACVQLFFFFTLNTSSTRRISDIEVHLLMWVFQCIFILPIWYIAYLFRKNAAWQQVIANTIFFIAYTFFWYGPVMQWVATLHGQLQQLTQQDNPNKIAASVDTWAFFYYQVLKHAWRLGWFFVADFFYHYKREEKQRLELLVANKELQLSLIKWHLNPDFYFKTINSIASRAKSSPEACSGMILNLSKVMEFVIYRSREKFIPVAEELSFLENYLSLQNLDHSPGEEYRIQVSGDPGDLRIIPLLLVSLLEGQLHYRNNNGHQKKCIDISFAGKTMGFNAGVVLTQTHQHLLQPSLQMRLEEFYTNKYRFTDRSPGNTWLEIQLNEVR